MTSPLDHTAGRPATFGRALSRGRALLDRVLGRRDRPALGALDVAGVLDLFEEHLYAGEITSDGRYVALSSSPMVDRLFGAPLPAGAEPGSLWESLIHVDDWQSYLRFNRRLLGGDDADASYRVTGLDGITRLIRDRARPVRLPDGRVRVQGLLSDITGRADADARAAEAANRFTSLLDVVGEHVYLAIVHADGSVEEMFQGPGADRLLGGAEPDPEMLNWDAAIHPEDRAAYDAFNRAARRRARERRRVPPDRRRQRDALGPRSRRDAAPATTGRSRSAASSPTSPSSAACAPSWRLRMPLSRGSSRRWTTIFTPCASCPTASAPRSTEARIARRWSADRCRAAPTTTYCGRRCCTRMTAHAGRRRCNSCRMASRSSWSIGSSASTASSGPCSTGCGPAASPTARSTSTASPGTSRSAGGSRTTSAGAWPTWPRRTASSTPHIAPPSSRPGPTT